MMRLFVGYDPREEVGSHVFTSSVLQHASGPVSITHLHKPALESAFGQKFAQGSNAFTASRFLVPALVDFAGPAVVFADGADMLCTSDICELATLGNPFLPVSVVKWQYASRHKRKYVGTMMEAENTVYDRKQWASVMVIRPWHMAWRRLTPDKVADMPLIDLLQFRFLSDDQIGDIPREWNWLADEFGHNPNAKLLHWSAGSPGFKEYETAPHSDQWYEQLSRVNHAC